MVASQAGRAACGSATAIRCLNAGRVSRAASKALRVFPHSMNTLGTASLPVPARLPL